MIQNFVLYLNCYAAENLFFIVVFFPFLFRCYDLLSNVKCSNKSKTLSNILLSSLIEITEWWSATFFNKWEWRKSPVLSKRCTPFLQRNLFLRMVRIILKNNFLDINLWNIVTVLILLICQPYFYDGLTLPIKWVRSDRSATMTSWKLSLTLIGLRLRHKSFHCHCN